MFQTTSKIQKLAQYISYTTNVKALGGRCTVSDETRCILYDYSKWDEDMTDKIKRQFPTCKIEVCASDSSLSGFVVIFTLHESTNIASQLLVLITMLSIMITIFKTAFTMVYNIVPLAPEKVIHFVQNITQNIST